MKLAMKKPTDSERLDALERYIQDSPLTIWDGNGPFPGGKTPGLGLVIFHGSLREAIDTCIIGGLK